MRFWDSSALVPLLLEESQTEAARRIYHADTEILAWWATEIECTSAIARRGRLDDRDVEDALAELAELVRGWRVVEPTEPLKRGAARAVRAYGLTAADAFQLAAAVAGTEGDTRSLPFVTLDDRLADAARREGFRVVVPS